LDSATTAIKSAFYDITLSTHHRTMVCAALTQNKTDLLWLSFNIFSNTFLYDILIQSGVPLY